MKNYSFKILLIFCILSPICAKIVTNLCSKPINNPNISEGNEPQSVCECVTENSPRWGELVLVIDCSEKELENEGFQVTILPNFTVSLDLPYNKFTTVPLLEGDELNFLDVSDNQLNSLVANNFIQLPNLVHLDLSNNQIENIHKNAFNGLSKLTKLQMENNALHILPESLFSPMTSLNHLLLSRNFFLNETFSQIGMDLYLRLGVTPNLQKLEMERCNLTKIDLGRGSWLNEVNLAGNFIGDLTDMPSDLRILDFSKNNIEVVPESFFTAMIGIEMILMQDMPELTSVAARSFYPLRNLKHVSFRGSKKLENFDAEAFGSMNDEKLPQLEILNLQGTKISTLNESMYDLIKNVKALDLDGAPLDCDCNLRWMKELQIETNGQCRAPQHLRGYPLSGVAAQSFLCRMFPKWVYTTINGILILVVLVLCSLAVWFVTMKLMRTTNTRHKTNVHSSSPYAPITVPTNNRESTNPYY